MDEHKSIIKLLTAIIPRDKGEELAQFLTDSGAVASTILYGHGTAPEYWSDLLGLGDSKSDVVFSIVRSEDVERIMSALNGHFHLSEVGMGIAFTVKISGLSSKSFLKFCTDKGE